MGGNIRFLAYSFNPLSVFIEVNIAKDTTLNPLLFEGAEHIYKLGFIVLSSSPPLNQRNSHSL